MGEFDAVNKRLNSLDGFVTKCKHLGEKIIEEMSEQESKRAPVAFRKFGAEQSEMIEKDFKDAIDSFYKDYTPTLYEREGDLGSQTGGLYNMYRPHKNRYGIITAETAVKESLAPVNRKGASLYDYVYMGGHHGGSTTGNSDTWGGPHPKEGTPLWRKGGWSLIADEDGNRKWNRFGAWGKVAETSEDPPGAIYNEKLEADIVVLNQRFEEICREELGSNVINYIQTVSIPKLLAELELN